MTQPLDLENEDLVRLHEQSLADNFNAFARDEAAESGRQVATFSLDGDDINTGADYVITDSHRFAIIEFKYNEELIGREARKPRRLTLCEKLAEDAPMRALHDRCHFVAWGEDPAEGQRVFTHIYRGKVCTHDVFGAACTWSSSPLPRSEQTAGQFVRAFLDGTHAPALNKTEFETYIGWVKTQTSGSNEATIELVASRREGGELYLLRFASIQSVYDWAQRTFPQPPPAGLGNASRPAGRRGPR